VVVGAILDDRGSPVQRARLRVRAADPRFDREVDAAGGAFGLRELPVGLELTLTATAPGFTSRTRTIRVATPSLDDETVNRFDFGGDGEGMWYYLSRTPEIASVDPANQASDVPSSPLRCTLTFSHPIPLEQRARLRKLIRLSPAFSLGDGEAPLEPGQGLGGETAQLTWADDGSSAVFTYGGPLVATMPGAAYELGFDEEADVSAWPRDATGAVLGRGLVGRTRDGAGGGVLNRVAPIARGLMDEPRPSAWPGPDLAWGATHHTSVRFELRRTLNPPRVVRVEHLAPDSFLVVFDKPMFGYPASALPRETLARTSYQFVLGRTTRDADREAFEAADVRRGSSPSGEVVLDPRNPTHLVLRDDGGKFADKTHFKLFISPLVKDIYGVAVGGDGIIVEDEL
jgi:hypothetical protein